MDITLKPRKNKHLNAKECYLVNSDWACEKKSVNSVFYDYIFTYPALWIPE